MITSIALGHTRSKSLNTQMIDVSPEAVFHLMSNYSLPVAGAEFAKYGASPIANSEQSYEVIQIELTASDSIPTQRCTCLKMAPT